MGQERECVQDSLAVKVDMIFSMGLEANLEKTKAMVCTPRFIWRKWGETAYKKQAKGEGATFRERKKKRASCTECGVPVATSYLKTHMARIHVICAPQKRGVDEVVGGPTT